MGGKRRRKRLSIFSRADVRPKGKRALMEAYVANLTQEGVGLYIQESLTVGQKVAITLHFVNHEGVEVTEKVEGKIAWCKKAYAAGVALSPLNKKEHPYLATFLQALEEEPN